MQQSIKKIPRQNLDLGFCLIFSKNPTSEDHFSRALIGQKRKIFIHIAIVGVSSCIVINVPTRYLLVAETKQSFQIVVGKFQGTAQLLKIDARKAFGD